MSEKYHAHRQPAVLAGSLESCNEFSLFSVSSLAVNYIACVCAGDGTVAGMLCAWGAPADRTRPERFGDYVDWGPVTPLVKQ